MVSDARQSVLGILWFVVLALVAGANGWLIAGCIAPYFESGQPDYLLLLRPISAFVWWALGCFIVLLAAHLAYARLVLGIVDPRSAFEWRYARYLSPLLMLLLPLASVAMLATRLRRYTPPWLYVSIDLRWWLLLGIGVLVVVNATASTAAIRNPRTDGRDVVGTSQRPRIGFSIALAAVLIAASLLSSPRMRFQSVLVGDEPKYLRYVENWYRGRGMDVADLGPIAELPPDFRAHPGKNVPELAASLAQVARNLIADGRRLVGLRTSPRADGATSLGGWFVKGKRGGVYQVHNPGVSFLLFPGYLVDRALSRTHGWHPLFPTDLYFTNLTLLVLYVMWGLAVFQLLRTYTGQPIASWLITSVVFLSLPTTALAYRYYPEVAAGLAVALLVRYALLSRDTRTVSAIGHGLIAGFLPWLHVRFMLLAVALTAAVVIGRRGSRSTLIAFAGAFALPVVALAVYYFHITGSPFPWALYGLTQDEPLFSAARAWRDLPSLWLDRRWGLVANAPVYLLALPGLWLVWQRHKALAAAIVVAILTIAIPAAGHGYTGAFTTPLRLVAAVVPLLVVPLAAAAIRFRTSRWFVASLALLSAISIQNGLTYNIHLAKNEAWLQAANISGWLTPLLLPDFDAGHRLAQPLTWTWLLATAGLVIFPMAFARRTPDVAAARRAWSWTAVAFAAVLLFASIGSMAGAISGTRFAERFMLPPGDARDRVIHFELTGNPGVRWSSEKGWIDLPSYFPNPDSTTATVITQPERPVARTPVEIGIDARRPGNRPGWGTASIDFGDGSAAARVAIEGSARAIHTYARPGDYHVRVDVALWGLSNRIVVAPLHVGQN